VRIIFGLVAVTLAAMGAISVSVLLLMVVLRKTNIDAWLAILEKLRGVLAVCDDGCECRRRGGREDLGGPLCLEETVRAAKYLLGNMVVRCE
jgi:hypothetical protein